MWPAIAAGIGLVGSLIGGKDKPQTVTSHVDYARMVRDAEAAGFNPLTAIRNGGSAGFTTTTTPGLSRSAIFGEALGGFANFLANFDPYADQKRELEFQLVQAQVANLAADTDLKRKASIGGVPSATGGSAKSGIVPALGMVIGPQVGTVEPPTVTNPFPLGSGNDVRADRPDAEMAEQRYGDIFQEIFGIGNFLYDTHATMKKREKAAGNPSTRTWRHLEKSLGGKLILPPLATPRGGIYAQ